MTPVMTHDATPVETLRPQVANGLTEKHSSARKGRVLSGLNFNCESRYAPREGK